jgi:hypothetical protein
MTRKQLLDLPQRLASIGQPQFAQQLWLVPFKTESDTETVVIAVNHEETPSHHIVAYAKTLDIAMYKDLFHIALEQINGQTTVTRLWLPKGGFVVMESSAATLIKVFRES